jgi:hypothetical protein
MSNQWIAVVAVCVVLLAAACACEERCDGVFKIMCVTAENAGTSERRVDCRAVASETPGSAFGDRFGCAEVNGVPTCVLDSEPKSECADKGRYVNACAGRYEYGCFGGFVETVRDCTYSAAQPWESWGQMRDQFLCGVGLTGKARCSLEGKPLAECSGVPDEQFACRGPELRVRCFDGLVVDVERCNYPKYSCVDGSECNF